MNFDKTFEEIMKPVENDLNFVLDECEMGSDCPIHIRQDYMDLDGLDSFIVHYIGEYAIATRINPESANPMVRIGELLGMVKVKHMMTSVLYVGSDENSLEDSMGVVDDREAIRYIKFHENGTDDELLGHHMDIVEALREDRIVLKNFSERDIRELMDDAIQKVDVKDVGDLW